MIEKDNVTIKMLSFLLQFKIKQITPDIRRDNLISISVRTGFSESVKPNFEAK